MKKLLGIILVALFMVGCGSTKPPDDTNRLSDRLSEKHKLNHRLETIHWGSRKRPVYIFRVEVPDGWLVIYDGVDSGNMIFYSDPEHEWELD